MLLAMEYPSINQGDQMTASERQFKRSQHRFVVQLATEEAVYRVTSRDLSLGGIGITGCPTLAPREPVKLFVTTEAHSSDRCQLMLLWAIPVWQKDDEVGLRFLDVPPDVSRNLGTITHQLLV